MTDAVIVSTARTGLAKSWRGSLNKAHPVTYTGHVLQHAMERARRSPGSPGCDGRRRIHGGCRRVGHVPGGGPPGYRATAI
jgi:acetyl-CoA acetyltransferase